MYYNMSSMIKNYIKQEYLMRAEILTNICKHIDDLNRDGIIYHTIRNKLMNKLNMCVFLLNTCYNESLRYYRDIKHIPSPIEEKIIMMSNHNGFNLFISSCDNDIKPAINKYFIKTDKIIRQLFNEIGSTTISDIFKLTVGINYRDIMGIDMDVRKLKSYIRENKKNLNLSDLDRKIHNSSALIDTLIKKFVPVDMSISNKTFDNSCTTVLVNKYRCTEDNSDESSRFKFEIMLDNCYKITIKCRRTLFTYVIYGYFEYDVINATISTSQVCDNFIYYKKKLLIDYVKNNITNKFVDVYLNNMSVGDIISHKGRNLLDRVMADYELYTKSCNLKFKMTVNDFLKSGINKKYNILRCLLLGSKNSIKNAAMLFGMTKDQNRDGKNNKSIIADIIFRNLNHYQQSKLRKSGHYIKQELDRIKKMSYDDMDLKQQCIMNNNMSDNIKKCVINKLSEMKMNTNEYHKNLIYVKTLIDYPWIPEEYCDLFTTINGNMEKCREKLKNIKEEYDKNVYGQKEFKSVIVDIVGKWLTNPNSMGKAIGLCGPPGCGKTLIASGLGKILNIPYQEIHLGGLEDGSVLNGHSFTYSGAQPGLIITKMVMTGEPRCILFFDELDKACPKHGTNEIFNVLIHATDSNANANFNDKFFQDVTFPLNKCIFIFSFNDITKIDPILRDRMEIINISSYSMIDKMEIAKNFLTRELLDDIGIERNSVIINSPILEYIISKYTFEAGVRKLKNCMEKIFLKLNVDRIFSKGPFKRRKKFDANNPITINKFHVLKYLGKPNINSEKIHSVNQIGVVNGLYATSNGLGGILPILCYPARSGNHEFSLEITGSQGKVMKESVSFAWTIAKNCVKTEIIDNFYRCNKGGIHIHTPEGAVSKDGPSAGAAFATAFISRLTGFPVKRNIAMTGEISIAGDVTAIGGLEHKLIGAKIAGVKLVFVCEQNLDDLKEIKEANSGLFGIFNPYKKNLVQKLITELTKKSHSNKNDFKVIIINSIFEIIPYALVDIKYIEDNYENEQYTYYDKTCNYLDFMLENNIGFKNNVLHADDIIVSSVASDIKKNDKI